MKLKDFLNEFSSDYMKHYKVPVCKDGFDTIRYVIEREGLRGCCTKKNQLAGSFDMVWTLAWAVKEWAIVQGNIRLENQMWNLMHECNSGRIKGRDARWAFVRRIAKLAGITNYSFKRRGNILSA